MKNLKIALLALILPLISVSYAKAQQDSVNLALDATASTSHVSPWESLEAVNDGVEPQSSAKTGIAYGNWNDDDGAYNWVQYEWNNAVNMSSTSVYWWDNDPGDVGIAQPNEAFIEYWSGSEWVKVGDIGVELDTYNSLKIGGVWSSKLKITMKSPAATGILEWKVYGQQTGDCDPTILSSTVKINNGAELEEKIVNVLLGDDVTINILPETNGQINWSGPNDFSASSNQIVIENIQLEQSGSYSVQNTNDCGKITSLSIVITVSSSNDGTAYTWPEYENTIYYDFKDEFPNLPMPTKVLEDCANVAGRKSSEWWTIVWGPKKRSEVTEVALTNMLKRLNTDFAYIRDTMGWPPDKRAKNGYKSAVYLYGSGLSTDNADTTEQGGWQGNIFFEGENWPMILASYAPVSAFDPISPFHDEYQMGGMVHEGIHAILADLPGAKQAAWFQEGGNTWLQQEMEARRTNDYSTLGFLNAAAMIAPFMPIECYSGWLQDGSFGGPSAEGVNMFDGSQQICTWRNLLGGNQYGNMFPIIFSQIFGDHSIAWIWRHCENRVLDGIADTLGDHQTRRLIMEYRAKQALVDMGQWTSATRKLLDNNFGASIKAEWQPSMENPEVWTATPYVKTRFLEDGLLAPEYRTTPGWSGANQIPLIVEGDMVKINFIPLDNNMGCQICYRATDGSTVYSQPVYGGICSLKLDKAPANNVVFVVVTNTDYIYEGEKTRTAHFNYRLELVEGVKERGNWTKKWYQWDETVVNSAIPDDLDFTVGINTRLAHANAGATIYPNPLTNRSALKVRFENALTTPAIVRVMDMNGRIIGEKSIMADAELNFSGLSAKGLYFVIITTEDGTDVHKLIVP